MRAVLCLVTVADGAAASGVADEVSLQALAAASALASGGAVHALVIGEGGASAAADLGAWGATQVHVATHLALTSFAPDAWARILADLADTLGVAAVVGPGSDAGNTVLARVAARLDLPFAANCTAVVPGDTVVVTRARWGGSLLEEAAINAPRAILTTQPHSIAKTSTGGSAAVVTFAPTLDDADLAVRVVGHVEAAKGGVSLAEAKIVVSGGRGVGSTDGFAPIEELAGLLGAAVGCSRAVTISGWRPHTDQVGQTGTKIAPDLYIACGISGATQHMAGVKGAKTILAINKDHEAPIMTGADYAVIGDLATVVPAISAAIRARRTG